MISSLTEKRKADRLAMAQAVGDLARSFNCTVERTEDGVGRKHKIRLEIEAGRGLCLSVEFDVDSCQPDIYVVPWYTTGKTKLALNFEQVGGEVNPHHFGKCTAVNYGWEQLFSSLKLGLEMARTGSAFTTRCDELTWF